MAPTADINWGQLIGFGVIILILGALLIALSRRSIKRWWLSRKAVRYDAKMFVKRYGAEAYEEVLARAEAEYDIRKVRHFRRVLRRIPSPR